MSNQNTKEQEMQDDGNTGRRRMSETDLKKLKRSELLEIMVAQSRRINDLEERLAAAEQENAERELCVKEAGSIAEASLKLTKVFEEAQKAADIYLDAVRKKK